jgi:tetratricopeptide (TPR) repeat protein
VAILRARAALMANRLNDAAAALAQTSEGFQRSGLGKLWQGEVSGAQGDFERAAADFTDSFQVGALRPMVRLDLVRALDALSRQKGPAEVEAKVNQLLKAFPDEPLLLAIGAELAVRQGRFDQALNMLDRADALRPNSLLIVRAKAAIRLKMGEVDRARAEAQRALQIDPRDALSRLLVAQADLAANKPEAALASVEEMLTGEPGLVEAHILRAEILRRLGRASDAVADLQDLLVRDPKAFAAYILAADIYEEQQSGEKALEILRAAQKQFPTQPLLGEKEIAVLCRLGRADEAKKAASRLAGPKPDADLCLALGSIFLNGKDLTAARSWAEQGMAFADKPRQTEAKLLLANILLLQGRNARDKTLLAQSRDYYRTVVDSQPENLLAANNLAWLLAVEFSQPEKARAVVDQALARTSVKRLPPDVADTFAMVYRETGQLDAAQQIIDQALRLAPELAMLNFQAGLVYGSRHRDDAAQAALRKALNLGLPEEKAIQAEAELRRLAAAAEQRRRTAETERQRRAAEAERQRQAAQVERERREAARQPRKPKPSGSTAGNEPGPTGR